MVVEFSCLPYSHPNKNREKTTFSSQSYERRVPRDSLVRTEGACKEIRVSSLAGDLNQTRAAQAADLLCPLTIRVERGSTKEAVYPAVTSVSCQEGSFPGKGTPVANRLLGECCVRGAGASLPANFKNFRNLNTVIIKI